jgi:hypothetical protein
VFILFVTANMVSATVTFADEKNDVFYYENGIVDRANDPHTYADVPEVDIHSVSFEATTGGTTVFLTVGADIIEDYVDGYDYSIRIHHGNTNDFDYYHLWTDNQNNGWHSWFNSNEHETYSFDGDTLSIFLAGISLDESTAYLEAQAVHYHSDGGMDSDWYPDGVEKQSGSDTSTDNNDDGSDNGSDDTDNTDSNTIDPGLSDSGDSKDSSNTDESNDDSSSDSPGFEWFGVFLAIALVVLFVRRR